MGATDTFGRMCASVGLTGPVEIAFRPSFDTVNAGVLLSLPALLAQGLLNTVKRSSRYLTVTID